eukprot:scaffold10599_cov46-Skeletonema_menzelii.AAC.1
MVLLQISKKKKTVTILENHLVLPQITTVAALMQTSMMPLLRYGTLSVSLAWVASKIPVKRILM